MKSSAKERLKVGPHDRKVALRCPETRLPLFEDPEGIIARDASGTVVRRWTRDAGIPDLIVGGRFEDATDDAGRQYEVESNTYSSRHYWIPLFQKLFPDHATRRYSILAVGCGVGVEVDLLADAGFAVFGIDCGNRTADWPRRAHPEGLLMANGLHMPFEDGEFDAVFCGCVFPHVGVIGDSRNVAEHGEADRQRLANEMVRVTKKGGHIVACSPNRRFPFDIFHWRKPGCYWVTCNPPWCRFLLSVSDFRRLFERAGAKEVRSLPVEGFWGFVTMRRSVKGRLMSFPLRTLFRLASLPGTGFLRGSCLMPWITIGCRA